MPLQMDKIKSKLGPATVSADIAARAEKPLDNPVVPSGTVSAADLAESTDVAMRLEKASRSLASYTLAELELMEPEKALQILTLREKLDSARKLSSQREADVRAQVQMLQEVENQLIMKAQEQDACERAGGHIRENGGSAISGQTDSSGTFVGICVKCQRIFNGIGAEAGQLPNHIANRVDWAVTGKG